MKENKKESEEGGRKDGKKRVIQSLSSGQLGYNLSDQLVLACWYFRA